MILEDTRDDFVDSIYDMFSDDCDNNRANQIIDIFDIATENCIELPCKVGDTVYVLDRDRRPREMILDAPDIRCHCSKEDNLCMALCDRKNTGICAYRFKIDGSDIGKTVFLTKEAAEQALRESENK